MLGIVTVNWHGFDVTQKLVKLVFENSYQDFKLVIVNNSSDEAVRFDNSELFKDGRIQIIHSNGNVGYSGGLNLGIKTLLRSRDVTHFLLLNNDVEFDHDFLGRMLAEGSENNKIYAPLILYMGTNLVQNTGGVIHIWLGGGRNLNKNVPVAKVRKVVPDFLSGCILFMHRYVIEKVGLFDEIFGSYVEDVDYCYRAKSLGVNIELLWGVQARHFHSHSTLGNNKYKVYLLNRNQIIFARKYLSFWPRCLFIAAAIVRGFLQNLIQGNLKYYFRGVKEGFQCL